MKLIGLLVLLALVSLVEGEVVESFAASCPQFFVKDENSMPVTPTVLEESDRYKQICQKYKNKYRYATLYDTSNRIPVYSAYKYKGYKKVKKKSDWMIEPQLDDLSGMSQNIAFGVRQALNIDYKNSGYSRGHVYPKCFNCDQDQVDSTFTLTNSAPQKHADNKNWNKNVETPLMGDIKANCDSEKAYVVTGVIPGNNFIKNRVNIPSHYWSAFSCKEKNGNAYMAQGYLLEMTGDGKSTAVKYEPIDAFNKKLKGLYKLSTPFKVFGEANPSVEK